MCVWVRKGDREVGQGGGWGCGSGRGIGVWVREGDRGMGQGGVRE